jgi:hypothetical protein
MRQARQAAQLILTNWRRQFFRVVAHDIIGWRVG